MFSRKVCLSQRALECMWMLDPKRCSQATEVASFMWEVPMRNRTFFVAMRSRLPGENLSDTIVRTFGREH